MAGLKQKRGYEPESQFFNGMVDEARWRAYRQKRDRTYRAGVQRRVRAIKLERGCYKCGFREHHAALEFHHRDPKTKKFRLSESRNYSWKMVLAEIDKCDVMCANCHQIFEYEKREAAKD